MIELRKRIGDRIKKIRIELKMTQEQLAREVGITTSYIGMLERGEKFPSVLILERIATILGVSIGFLADSRLDEKVEFLSLKRRKLIKMIYEMDSKKIDAISHVAEAMAK